MKYIMEKSLKNFILFEDKLWFVDFTTPGAFEIRIVLPDGTSRDAAKTDGNLMDVLNEGTTTTDVPSNFNPNAPTIDPDEVSLDNSLLALQRLKPERKKKITKEPEEIITLPNGKKIYKSLHELGKSLVSSMVKNLNEQTKKEQLPKESTNEPEEIITLPDGKRVLKSLHELGKSLTEGMVNNLNEQVGKEKGELVTLPDGEDVTKYLKDGEVIYILQNGKHVLKRNYKISPNKLDRIIVKYGALIGLAFMINFLYSAVNDLTVYSFESGIRTLLFSAILYLGSGWGNMDFDHPEKE